MSLGPALLVIVLVAVLILRTLLNRQAHALVGQPVPTLPEPFSDLAQADTLLWFHSLHCGPCHAMRPQVQALIAQGRAREIDVTAHLNVARALGVVATPTTVRVRAGVVEAVQVGALSAEGLSAMVNGRRRGA